MERVLTLFSWFFFGDESVASKIVYISRAHVHYYFGLVDHLTMFAFAARFAMHPVTRPGALTAALIALQTRSRIAINAPLINRVRTSDPK